LRAILPSNGRNFQLGATTLSIKTFRIMTLSIRVLFLTLRISDSQHK